jgi:transaldolase
MPIFLDSTIVSEIEKYHRMGIIRGVTTNPTIMLKDGRRRVLPHGRTTSMSKSLFTGHKANWRTSKSFTSSRLFTTFASMSQR